jgi:hypothetical protein
MPKTTFSVRKKRWELFTAECKAASLRRDDLLDRVLPEELQRLGTMTACDAAGAHWVRANWVTTWAEGDAELHPVPVMLSDEVLEQMNSTCADKGVPRDAFFDCVLTYLTQRLYEAVIVIKRPRTTRDLVSRMHDVLHEEDVDGYEPTNRDQKQWILDGVEKWDQERTLAALSDSFYSDRLSYTEERIRTERELLEALDLFEVTPTDRGAGST